MKDKLLFLVLLIIMGSGQFNYGQNWERLINLKGSWKFSIGDDKNWSKPIYDDHAWESIKVPSSWEEQGYNGYDGYAWYRKHVKIASALKGKMLRLNMGQIDDVDQVFFNGHLIGSSGIFPPNYNTAYSEWRFYYLPNRYINFNGDNVIAVRVYDSQLNGGITDGDIGIFGEAVPLKPELDLSGLWKFKTGDDLEWKEKKYDDKKWKDIIVPNYWEAQGYQNYDGFAWYRIKFILPDVIANKKLVLILGKIDDIDEAYINGTFVGSTGDLSLDRLNRFQDNDSYQKFRGYYIPDDLVHPNEENVIAVRVYDGFNVGGIYDGPVGIITQEKYMQHWKDQKKIEKKKSFWNFFFD
jgi:hypothetical protein